MLAGWLWRNAEQQRRETEIALAGSYFHQSVTRLEEDKPFEALAYAARAVALNPDGDAARALMLDLILWHPWPRLSLRAKSEVTSLALSTDGRLLIVASGEKASVYEVKSGTMRGQPLTNRSLITAVALTGDGKLAATGDAQGEIRLWNLDSDNMQGRSWTLVGPIRSLAFSRDGKRLVAGAMNGAQVWNAITGDPLGPHLVSGSVVSFEFGANDTRVVTVQDLLSDGVAQVWDADRGAPVGEPIKTGGTFSWPSRRRSTEKRSFWKRSEATVCCRPNLDYRLSETQAICRRSISIMMTPKASSFIAMVSTPMSLIQSPGIWSENGSVTVISFDRSTSAKAAGGW